MANSISTALRGYLAPMASARAMRILLIVCVVFPAALLVLVSLSLIPRDALLSIPAFVIVPGLPLLATVLSEMALRDGITHRTLLYPLLGPVPRATLAATRTLATGALLFLITAGLVAVVRLICSAPWGPFPRELLALGLGSFAYAALAGLIHIITPRGLIAGLAIFGGLDNAIGRLPFSAARIAPSHHLRVLADQLDPYSIPISINAPDDSMLLAALCLALFTAGAITLTAVLFARRNLATLC